MGRPGIFNEFGTKWENLQGWNRWRETISTHRRMCAYKFNTFISWIISGFLKADQNQINTTALPQKARKLVTHLLKSASRREGAGGSETLDTSTVQRPLCVVCKRSRSLVANNSDSARCSRRAECWSDVNDQWFSEKHHQSSSHLEKRRGEEHKNGGKWTIITGAITVITASRVMFLRPFRGRDSSTFRALPRNMHQKCSWLPDTHSNQHLLPLCLFYQLFIWPLILCFVHVYSMLR